MNLRPSRCGRLRFSMGGRRFQLNADGMFDSVTNLTTTGVAPRNLMRPVAGQMRPLFHRRL
jgi:hypothetical protein